MKLNEGTRDWTWIQNTPEINASTDINVITVFKIPPTACRSVIDIRNSLAAWSSRGQLWIICIPRWPDLVHSLSPEKNDSNDLTSAAFQFDFLCEGLKKTNKTS